MAHWRDLRVVPSLLENRQSPSLHTLVPCPSTHKVAELVATAVDRGTGAFLVLAHPCVKLSVVLRVQHLVN
jgi:hypothetical protein